MDTQTILNNVGKIILLVISLLFVQCDSQTHESTQPELIISHWFFASEPSCVNTISDGKTVAVGTEDGNLYLIRNEKINKLHTNFGTRIYKTEYLGKKEGLDIYMISVRHKGLHIIGISNDSIVSKDIYCSYENDALPYKGNRYTAYDWIRKEDNIYLATSNGIWTCQIDLANLDLDNEELTMRRVGPMGIKKPQYAITSISSFNNQIYFSSQDGLWVLCNDSMPKRISADSIKYNCMITYKDKLTAFNDQTIITIAKDGSIQTTPNEYKAKFIIPINDSTRYYFTDNKLYVNGRKEEFDLRITQYAKNTFAVSYDRNVPQGIYMIQGNDLIYVDVQLVMMYNPSTILGICEEKKDNTAFLIDNNWNLFSVSDNKSSLIGHINNINEAITDMIVMNNDIYLITTYSLYKVPTAAVISHTIKAEKIDIFKDKGNMDLQTERMVMLYNQDRNNSLIIATRAHLWNLDISSPISANNPIKLHIKARTHLTTELQDLDEIYESCNVQAIARYPYKNSSDLLVGTRDFGIISFDKNSINTLIPETWLGLNDRSIRNIKSIDIISNKENNKIKIIISSSDQIHLVTFRTNSPKIITSHPYSAKNTTFINEDLALAVSEIGGITLFDVSTDTIVYMDDYYKKIYFKPQLAGLKNNVILNSNVGPYLFNKQTNNLSILDFNPDEQHNTGYYIYISLLCLICIVACYFIVIRILQFRKYSRLSQQLKNKEITMYGKSLQKTTFSVVMDSAQKRAYRITLEELNRRSAKLLQWWEEEYREGDLFKEEILNLINRLPSGSFNFDDEFYTLKDHYSKETTYKQVIQTLADIYKKQFGQELSIDSFIDFKKVLKSQPGQVTIDKLVRRMQDLSGWWTQNSNAGIKFQNGINELIVNRLSDVYDFSEKLKNMEYLHNRYSKIKEIHSILPFDLSTAGYQDEIMMSEDIIKALRIIQVETEWLNRATNAYTNLVNYEQKIGKCNPNFWQQILEERQANNKQSLFNEQTQKEIKSVLKLHADADYSTALFDAPLKGNAAIVCPAIDIPVQTEEDCVNYILNHEEEIRFLIQGYFTHEQSSNRRETIINHFITEKEKVENILRSTYLRIINMEHTGSEQTSNKSKLVDYFKNLLTYLYYHLFVMNNQHILNYNDKEHRYDSYYDFQQQIIMLSTFLDNDNAPENSGKYDMRPLILKDKLCLTIEGSDSKENSISKFKDKTKTLHLSFYKKTDWNEYVTFVNLLFEVYPPLKKLYGIRPKRMEK